VVTGIAVEAAESAVGGSEREEAVVVMVRCEGSDGPSDMLRREDDD